MKKKLFSILLTLAMVLTMMPAMASVSFAGEANTTVPVELVKATTSGSRAIKLSWNKVSGATKYVVYGQKCGKKYKKLTTTTKTSYKVKKIKKAKLKAHKTYKFYVVAYKGSKKLVTSKSIHFITGKTMGKYANAKSIKVSPTSVTLEPGKTAKLKTTTKIYKNKKHIKTSHGAATRYVSDNPTVATVNSKGVVTAKKEGTATIYVQDIGGLWCKTVITVKLDRFTVSFDANGHGTAPETETVVKGEKVTEPEEPTETGYTFGGWYKEADCTNEWKFDSDTVTANTTLYAKWTANTYTVNFDANTGSGDAMPSQNFTYGVAQKLTKNTYTRLGYNFIGWHTDSSATEALYSDEGEVINLTPDKNGSVTLYAIWTERENVTITYQSENMNKGTVEPASEGVAPATGVASGSTATAATGYTFANWTNASQEEVSTSVTFVPGKVGGLNVEATYTAHFTANTYKVTFDGNYEGTGYSKEISETYDSKYELPVENPTRTGYTFDGWFTEATGGTQVTAETDVKITADSTLYAHWTANTYTVKFFANGGSGSMDNQTFTYDTPQKLTKNNFSPAEEKAFLGWTTTDGGETVEYEDEKEVSNLTSENNGEITLYAVWGSTCTVTFDLNGITGTAPDAQTIASGKKVTKPTDPTDTIHTFDGWYKTKDDTTGKLSDKWDFTNNTVTEDMTLYAQWTRTLGSIIATNPDVPVSSSNPPENAWVNGNNPDCKAYVNSNNKFVLMSPKSVYTTPFKMDAIFVKVNDNYKREDSLNSLTATCCMVNGKFVAFEYEDTSEICKFLSGTYAPPTFKAVYNTKDGANTLTFYYDAVDHSGDGITVYDNLPTAATSVNDWGSGYNNNRSKVKSVVIDSTVANYTGLTSTVYMFASMTNAENISGAEYLNVSNVTDMSYMFQNYGSSSTVLSVVPDVSKWNTSNVTNLAYMFRSYGSSSTALNAVPAVNGSNWNTGNVTDMSGIFYGYGSSSTALNAAPDMSGWNTGSVTDMKYMFQDYGKKSAVLTAVPNVSNWNTGKVTDMSYMFYSYGKSSTVLNAVPAVDGSNWNTVNVTNLAGMFESYGSSSTALTKVPDVSKWNTSKVTSLATMFKNYGSSSAVLEFKLDLSGWSVESVTAASKDMFTNDDIKASTWSVTIPAKTGEQDNDTTHWYVCDGTNTDAYIQPATGKQFTLAVAPVTYMDWDDLNKKLVEKPIPEDAIEVTNTTATLVAGKFYVVKGEDVQTKTLTVNGTAAQPTTLILMDGAKLTATGTYSNFAGVMVADSNALVITGQKLGTGALIATGNNYGAGIGNSASGGTVTVNGGTVTATGGNYAAGIGGGGNSGNGGTVTVNGGTVTATGGVCGAGIGGGQRGSGGAVTINGGTVTATGGDGGPSPDAAAIGAGVSDITVNPGTVTFGSDVNFTVKAGDAAPGTETTTTAYADDHSAAYVHIEESAAPAGNPNVFDYAGAETILDFSTGKYGENDIASGNPIVINGITGNLSITGGATDREVHAFVQNGGKVTSVDSNGTIKAYLGGSEDAEGTITAGTDAVANISLATDFTNVDDIIANTTGKISIGVSDYTKKIDLGSVNATIEITTPLAPVFQSGLLELGHANGLIKNIDANDTLTYTAGASVKKVFGTAGNDIISMDTSAIVLTEINLASGGGHDTVIVNETLWKYDSNNLEKYEIAVKNNDQVKIGNVASCYYEDLGESGNHTDAINNVISSKGEYDLYFIKIDYINHYLVYDKDNSGALSAEDIVIKISGANSVSSVSDGYITFSGD